MEILKKHISINDSIDRNYNSPTYGTITATSFYINVMLTQDIDNMGQFTDVSFVTDLEPDYSLLIDKLSISGITFPFMSGAQPLALNLSVDHILRVTGRTVVDYYNFGGQLLTGNTDSRAIDVMTYSNTEPYRLNFDVNSETYIDYNDNVVNGVDRVTSLGNPMVYVFGADKNDPNIGTTGQTNGLVFQDLSGLTNQTSFSFYGQGWNETDISLSAITKEEYLLGITSSPEVNSDVFIDRGIVSIFERHLKLAEITNLGELSSYGKGYYNLTVQ